MHEQVIVNLKEAVKDEIKKQDLDNKKYGFEIGRDFYNNMTLLDLHNYFSNNMSILSRLSLGDVSFEEAEKAVLKWRSSNDSKKAASERS